MEKVTAGLRVIAVTAIAGWGLSMPGPAVADTLEWALVQAYQNNPQLNSQRAIVRADRRKRAAGAVGLSPARHRRPPLSARQYQSTRSTNGGQHLYVARDGTITPHGVGVTATQTLFNGFQTGNRTRQAEAQVSAARETLAPDRADRAAQCRDRLHERAARHRDPRSAAAQRRGAAGAAAPDPRSLQCRRGDAHRRRAVRIARSPPAARRC